MKLVIQIPCLNEEKTLPQVVADLPRSIEGIDIIETQIVDDGSTDRTVEVAKELKINHIVSFKHNLGLAKAFKEGMESALIHNADILVNTDGDNQYCGADIAKLVKPIVEGRADIVVGCRPIKNHPEFSFFKKIFQRIGSAVLRNISKTNVRDAASGFRAYSKNALIQLNIHSTFSYCMETLIQAGLNNIKIETVDINVNPKTRRSRLFKNIFGYMFRSTRTIVHIYLLYRAKSFCITMAIALFLMALGLLVRYLALVYHGAPPDHFWPTVILSGILFSISFQVLLVGILAALTASNRNLLEEINIRIKREKYDTNH